MDDSQDDSQEDDTIVKNINIISEVDEGCKENLIKLCESKPANIKYDGELLSTARQQSPQLEKSDAEKPYVTAAEDNGCKTSLIEVAGNGTIPAGSASEDSDVILDEEYSRDDSSDQHDQGTSQIKSSQLDQGSNSKLEEDGSSMDSSITSEVTTTTVLKRSTRKITKPKIFNFSQPKTQATSTKNRFVRDKALFDEMKFMADFDPKRSNRNQEKKRKRYTDGRPQLIADHYDDCDCLMKNCPGCHYPCKRCGDSRCGHECRQGRRWLYESIEIEGRGIELRNPHVDQ